MASPAFIRLVIDETTTAGRRLLETLKAQGVDAGAQGAAAVEEYARQMAELLSRRTGGLLSAVDYARAVESYAESLEFTLASIGKEFARAQLENLLGRSSNFLASIIGVGLRAVGG